MFLITKGLSSLKGLSKFIKYHAPFAVHDLTVTFIMNDLIVYARPHISAFKFHVPLGLAIFSKADFTPVTCAHASTFLHMCKSPRCACYILDRSRACYLASAHVSTAEINKQRKIGYRHRGPSHTCYSFYLLLTKILHYSIFPNYEYILSPLE